MNQDEEQLRLLSIFHYIVAGLAGLMACFPFIHLTLGLAIVFAPQEFDAGGQAPPAWFGWLFVIVAGVCIVLGWTLAGLIFATGRCLAKRRRQMFCLVMAGVECLFMPLGTVLGVFTIIVLMRESVKQLFNPKASF